MTDHTVTPGFAPPSAATTLRTVAVVAPGFAAGAVLLAMLGTEGLHRGSRLVILSALLFLPSLLVRSPAPAVPLEWRRPGVILATLGLAALLPVTATAVIFGRVDFFAFLFNMTFGLGGTPWAAFWTQALLTLTPFVVMGATLWRLRAWLQPLPFAWTAIGLALLAANPVLRDVALLRSGLVASPYESLAADYVPAPIAPLPARAARPNLVFLFLEGFDRGYTDPELFGDLAAPLREIEARGLSFTQVAQIGATGWSAAGHAAAWCGLPLTPNLSGYQAGTEVLPHVDCLPDVLAAHGYAQTYLSGATVTSPRYYGFDTFLGARALDAVRGAAELGPRFGVAGRDLAFDYWGLFDGELLEVVAEEVEARAAGGAPFAVYAATMDTHGPDAGLSPACTDSGRGELTPEMAPAVACVARMVATFVETLKARFPDERFVIVLTSDHLAHRNTLTDRLETRPRRNFVTILGAGRDGEAIDRPGSMIDVFPTVLDAMGLMPEGASAAGLGRSLLGPEPTLVERHGVEGVDVRLMRDTELGELIWP